MSGHLHTQSSIAHSGAVSLLVLTSLARVGMSGLFVARVPAYEQRRKRDGSDETNCVSDLARLPGIFHGANFEGPALRTGREERNTVSSRFLFHDHHPRTANPPKSPRELV